MLLPRHTESRVCTLGHARKLTDIYTQWREIHFAQCVCAYVGRQFSSHCSLMPFTCFNQHQSTLGMRLVILIENEKYNCWGGGREYSHISEYCFPFTCNIIGLNVVDQSNFADLHTPHADTAAPFNWTITHCRGVCQLRKLSLAPKCLST